MFTFDNSAQTRKLSFGGGWSDRRLVAGLSLLLCLAFAGSARAATYYVSPSGSNGNPGTSAQPWQTIQKAANTMQAGDTVIVEPGYYPEKVQSAANGTPGSPITFLAQAGVTNNGFLLTNNYNVVNGFNETQDPLPIYFPATNRTINAYSAAGGTVFLINGTGDVLENFQIGNIGETNNVPFTKNYPNYNLVIEGAFNVVSNGNLFNINANAAINILGFTNLLVGCMINNTYGNDCIHSSNGTNNTIRGCIITNVYMIGPAQSAPHTDFVQCSGGYGGNNVNLLIEQCIVWPGAIQVGNMDSGNGFYIGNITYRNNIFFGAALHASFWTPNMAFYNNAFIMCGMNFSEELYFITGDTNNGTPYNCSVFNNIFLECGNWASQPTSGFYSNPGTPPSPNNFRADYNYASGFGWQPKATYLTDTNVGDNVLIGVHDISGGNPGFVNFIYTTTNWLTCVDPNCDGGSPVMISTYYNFDLHLLSSSILKGAGTNLSSIFTNDFAGNARPATGAWSIGPFQFTNSDSGDMLPPSDLRVVSMASPP